MRPTAGQSIYSEHATVVSKWQVHRHSQGPARTSGPRLQPAPCYQQKYLQAINQNSCRLFTISCRLSIKNPTRPSQLHSATACLCPCGPRTSTGPSPPAPPHTCQNASIRDHLVHLDIKIAQPLQEQRQAFRVVMGANCAAYGSIRGIRGIQHVIECLCSSGGAPWAQQRPQG